MNINDSLWHFIITYTVYRIGSTILYYSYRFVSFHTALICSTAHSVCTANCACSGFYLDLPICIAFVNYTMVYHTTYCWIEPGCECMNGRSGGREVKSKCFVQKWINCFVFSISTTMTTKTTTTVDEFGTGITSFLARLHLLRFAPYYHELKICQKSWTKPEPFL